MNDAKTETNEKDWKSSEESCFVSLNKVNIL